MDARARRQANGENVSEWLVPVTEVSIADVLATDYDDGRDWRTADERTAAADRAARAAMYVASLTVAFERFALGVIDEDGLAAEQNRLYAEFRRS